MYESHFGFSGSPFQLNPDPAFYFGSRGHSNALAYLKFGAHQGEGFIVVTGEIGAGKTTLVRTLLDGLDPNKVVAAQVVSTQLESSELLQAILIAFGIASSKTSKAHLIASLEAFLTATVAKGRRALLIIDEAQNLKHEAVEELRMLSNFQLGNYGLLQSFLVGQPELRALLQSKSMEQLRQRVIASCHLGPLDNTETRAYIEHRLRLVGWKGTSPEFAPQAIDRVHHWTGGVPRRINRLCNRLLLGVFLANAKQVSMAMVDETALELKNEIGEASATPPPTPPRKAPENPFSALPSNDEQVADAPVADPAVPDAVVDATPGPDARVASYRSPASEPPAADRLTERRQASETTGSALSPNIRSVAPDFGSIGAGAWPMPATTRHVHRQGQINQPLICLVDSPASYLMAGALAGAFEGFPSLPRVVAVHAGAETELGLDDLAELKLPLPEMGIHLGVARGSCALRSSGALEAFDALLTELQPCAVMVLGSSDSDLACALVARKRGIPLLRSGSGRHGVNRALNTDANAVLIERIADINYTDSTEAFYALYREGIRLDRVQSVGSLDREMLDIVFAAVHESPVAETVRSSTGAAVTAGGYGLITVDPFLGFTSPDGRRDAVELFRELSQELPLVWLLPPNSMSAIELDRKPRIEACGLIPLEVRSIRQALALLQGAKCVISRMQGPWLEESKAIVTATLILAADLSLERVGVGLQPPQPNPAGPASLSAFRRLLGEQASSPPPPDYWDTGTAIRIAGHLVKWLSPAVQAPRKAAEARPEAAAHEATGS